MDSYICVLMVCFKSMHLFPRDEHLIYSLFTYFLETADFFSVVNPKVLCMTKKWKSRKKIVKIFIFDDTEFYKLCIKIVNGWCLTRIKYQQN